MEPLETSTVAIACLGHEDLFFHIDESKAKTEEEMRHPYIPASYPMNTEEQMRRPKLPIGWQNGMIDVKVSSSQLVVAPEVKFAWMLPTVRIGFIPDISAWGIEVDREIDSPDRYVYRQLRPSIQAFVANLAE